MKPLQEYVFTPQHRQLLQNTVITEDAPGTILRDFATLIQFVDETAPQVTGTYSVLPMKALGGLNEQMSHPLALALNRAQQKSYPHINGLYLLLRTTGLAQVDRTGRKPELVINAAARAAWAELNPTERYFTLFEAWLLHANQGILGEHTGFFNDTLTQYWKSFFERLPPDGLRVTKNDEDSLRYRPTYLNLALMELFGLVQIQHGAAVAGLGWRIETIHRTAWGDALLALFMESLVLEDAANKVENEEEESETSLWYLTVSWTTPAEVPYGQFQRYLQPYFPLWQKNLSLDQPGFRPGRFTFKVALDKKLYRVIAIGAEATLDELSSLILNAYDFDHDHLYRFVYTDPFGTLVEVNHPMLDEGPYTDEVRVGDLALQIGDVMLYHYDFGDDWKFNVSLEHLDVSEANQKPAEVLQSVGEAPAQYYYGEEEEEEEEGDWEMAGEEEQA